MTMIPTDLLEQLLDFPDTVIEKVELCKTSNTLSIYVKSTKEGCPCHCCGQFITTAHGLGAEIELRHLPIFGYKTLIKLKPKRYRCPDCDTHPTSTQQLDGYTPRSSFTKSYENELLRSLTNSTIEDVSIKCEVSSDQVETLINRYLDTSYDYTETERIDVIGIDEISLRKGHGQFVTIVSAIIEDQVTVLAVLPDRKKATVKRFFLGIPKRLRKTVRAVCSDVYSGFMGAAREVFGRRIALCADRFHVAKRYREGFEKVRRKEMKKLKALLSKEEYRSYKNTYWILRKNRENLTSDEWRLLKRLFKKSPEIEQAYHLVQSLTSIYNSPLTPGQAKRKLSGWIKRVRNSGLSCFDTFIKTLRNHWGEISNYFIDRKTSGFVEGLNNKIKVLKRRSYGMVNPNRFFQRIHIDLHGYERFSRKLKNA